MTGDAEAGTSGTRAALLAAARELFAARGFDHTTVRAIAERAGVNQALLFRHFGSKDALFAAALSAPTAALVEQTPPDELIATTLRRIFAVADGGEAGAMLALLRSPGTSPATRALRDRLAEPYRAAFTARDDADDPDEAVLRADLLLAWLLGIGFARAVLEVPSLAAADPESVVAHVERAAAALLDRPPDPDRPPDEDAVKPT